MRKLPKIFLSCYVALLICAAQAQVRSVRIGPAIPTPPPAAPTSRTFLSPNRKFKLVLEEATLAPISGPRNMPLNAAIVEEQVTTSLHFGRRASMAIQFEIILTTTLLFPTKAIFSF